MSTIRIFCIEILLYWKRASTNSRIIQYTDPSLIKNLGANTPVDVGLAPSLAHFWTL